MERNQIILPTSYSIPYRVPQVGDKICIGYSVEKRAETLFYRAIVTKEKTKGKGKKKSGFYEITLAGYENDEDGKVAAALSDDEYGIDGCWFYDMDELQHSLTLPSPDTSPEAVQ